MWVRDYRSPPEALALLQVYHRFAPLTDFRGLTWRYQVEQEVSLQCYLMGGQLRGSFLDVRHRPRLEIDPPLMRIEGQLDSPYPEELPLQDWIAQGTRWWLRSLGSTLVDKPLRLSLLSGLLSMDRIAYPELDSAVAYHPIIPLCDGSWISLEELRGFPKAFCVEVISGTGQKGWSQGLPVVQTGGCLDGLNELLERPLVPLQPGMQPAQVPWQYRLLTARGEVILTAFREHLTDNSNWVTGSARNPEFRTQDLISGNPLAFLITATDYFEAMGDWGAPRLLRQAVVAAICRQAEEILLSLPLSPLYLHEICSLAALLLEEQRPVPDAVWSYCFNGDDTLKQVRFGQANLNGFARDHPIYLLRRAGRRNQP